MRLPAPMGGQNTVGRTGHDEQEAHPMSTRSTPACSYGPLTPSLFALRGIRFFSGEDGAGAGGDGGGDNGDGGDSGQGGDQGGNAQGAGQGGNGGDSSQRQQQPRPRAQGFSPEYVKELRDENAARRKNEGTLSTRAETAERERDEARLEANTLKRERAIEKAAPKGGANPSALLDSREFARATADPALSAAAAVEKAIKDFVEQNPHVAAAPSSGAGSSGPGRPGGQSQTPPDYSNDLAGALGAAMARP